MDVEVLIPTKSVIFAIFEHASVDEVLRLQNSISVQVSAVELSDVNLLLLAVEEVLAVAGHLAVDPLALVPLARADDELDADAILPPVAKLSFVNVAIVVPDLADSLDLVVLPEPFKDVAGLGDQLAQAMLLSHITHHLNFTLIDVSVFFMDYLDILPVQTLDRFIHSECISEVDSVKELMERALRIRIVVLNLAEILCTIVLINYYLRVLTGRIAVRLL